MWTAEQARAFAPKGGQATAEVIAKRKADEANGASPVQADEYLARRIARLRRQLDMLDTMIERGGEPQALDRAASARWRVWQEYKDMIGLPSPGQRRPVEERKRQSTGPASSELA